MFSIGNMKTEAQKPIRKETHDSVIWVVISIISWEFTNKKLSVNEGVAG